MLRLCFNVMMLNDYEACPECDLLLHAVTLRIGEKAHCPRCGLLLARPSAHSIERCFALAIAGLILCIPANFLPMVTIKMMGKASDGTLWSGVAVLMAEEMTAVALVVFLASILFPLIYITLSLLISGHLYFQRPNRYLANWMRWLQHLQEWAMLEVYMLGIIVACVKLLSIAQLKLGFGLYAFVALLIITSLLTSSLDKTVFWQRIAELGNHHEN
jgi:paraquat-inducible protein A